jgi:hypothetical protein
MADQLLLVQDTGAPGTEDEVAVAMADLLAVPVRRVGCPDIEGDSGLDDLVAEVERPDVVAAVVPSGDDVLAWSPLLESLTTPLVVVPPSALRVRSIQHVLVALDGTPETTQALRGWHERLRDGGADLRAVHVIDQRSVPPFWDQHGHEARPWREAFLERADLESAELELRRGRPAEEVLAALRKGRTDLLLLAWGRRLGPHRARVVRGSLTSGRVPVMLVPLVPHD